MTSGTVTDRDGRRFPAHDGGLAARGGGRASRSRGVRPRREAGLVRLAGPGRRRVRRHPPRPGRAPGDVVCLLLPSSIKFATCYLGALRARAITSAINLRLGAGRAGEHPRAHRAGGHGRRRRRRAPRGRGRRHRIHVSELGLRGVRRRAAAVAAASSSPTDATCIVWTSGTTGAAEGRGVRPRRDGGDLAEHRRAHPPGRPPAARAAVPARRLHDPHVGRARATAPRSCSPGEPWSAEEYPAAHPRRGHHDGDRRPHAVAARARPPGRRRHRLLRAARGRASGCVDRARARAPDAQGARLPGHHPLHEHRGGRDARARCVDDDRRGRSRTTVGRPTPDVELRIVDAATGATRPPARSARSAAGPRR